MPDQTYSQQLTEAYRKAATGAAWNTVVGNEGSSAEAWKASPPQGGSSLSNGSTASGSLSDGMALRDPAISNDHSAPF